VRRSFAGRGAPRPESAASDEWSVLEAIVVGAALAFLLVCGIDAYRAWRHPDSRTFIGTLGAAAEWLAEGMDASRR
jgi:hypothetical protein